MVKTSTALARAEKAEAATEVVKLREAISFERAEKAFQGNDIGWIDPRVRDEDGGVLSPRRFKDAIGKAEWSKLRCRAHVCRGSRHYPAQTHKHRHDGVRAQQPCCDSM